MSKCKQCGSTRTYTKKAKSSLGSFPSGQHVYKYDFEIRCAKCDSLIDSVSIEENTYYELINNYNSKNNLVYRISYFIVSVLFIFGFIVLSSWIFYWLYNSALELITRAF